ncbi:MAG: TonB-dependent receptor [Saprospiraceae bacterium]|nr:TonB-dependent receptor [Saprospiraceae bacterium]
MFNGIKCSYIFIFILGAFGSLVNAQQKTLSIRVQDESSLEPLVGAIVEVNDNIGLTNENGEYNISFDSFPVTIVVTYLGYDDFRNKFSKLTGNNVSIFLKPTKTILDLVTVTGSKFERNLAESTISLDIIQPQLLRSTNVAKSSDILNKVPGVQILDGQANIRGGSGYSYGAGSRVMLLVNDIPALQVDAGFPNWNDIPIESLAQIEVVKGAASTLYGSAALNGIVNFRTAYATSTPETRIMTSYTHILAPKDKDKKWWEPNSRYQVNASFLHKRKFKKWDFIGSGFFNKLESHLEHTNEIRGRVFTSVRYRWSDKLLFELAVNGNASEGSAYFLWKNSGSGAFQALPTTITNRNSNRWYFDPSITFFDKYNNKHRWVWRVNTINNRNDTNQSNKSINHYGEYQFQNHYKKWDIVTTAGAVGMHNSTDSQILGDTTFTGTSMAGYVQVEKKFFNKLSFSGGLRYEYVEQRSPSEFMGTVIPGGKASDDRWISRFGLNYALTDYTFLRTSWGQGYRFPTLTERFVTTSFGEFSIFSNPRLQPETGWSFEAAIKQAVPGFFKGYIDLAFFRSEYQNMIEFTFVPPPTLGFQPMNIGDIRISGMELSFMGQAKIGEVEINTITGYTYINTIYIDFDTREDIRNSVSTDQNVLKYRSKHQFKTDVETKYKDFALGVSFQRASHVINIDRAFEKVPPVDVDIFGIGSYRSVYNNGNFILDARLSYLFAKKFQVTVLANNILNNEYSLRPALVESPRNIGVRMELIL